MDRLTGVLLAGQALLLVANTAAGWILAAEREARRRTDSAVATLEARLTAVEGSAERLALFERRLDVIAPLDALRRQWATGGRPDGAGLAAALEALHKARLLFAGELSDELEEASALLETCLAHLQWEASTIESGRRDERADLVGRIADLQERLRATIETLHARLSEASRIPG